MRVQLSHHPIRQAFQVGALMLVAAGCQPSNEAAPTSGAGAVTFPAAWLYPSGEAPVRANRGMVVSTDEYASQVGIDILEAGGNAMDAAVATAFALAVVNPEAGNIGGGGFMLARMDGEVFSLDYREKAPLAATRDMFLDADGNLTDRSVVGHLAAGVPGTVMGLSEAHSRFGALPWNQVIEPAITLAEGFEVRARLVASLTATTRSLRLFAATEEIFLPGGSVPEIGDRFVQADLAATLRRIQELGPAGFYEGETADLIVAEMARGGGIITHEDLLAYRAAWRDPIAFAYRDYQVYSMPPSSSGGATMGAIANMVEQWDLNTMGWQSPEAIHVMVESFKRAYADRNEILADPDFVDMPIEEMVSDEYAAKRAASISLDRATPSSEIHPGLSAVDEGTNTTHFSVVDEAGNAVAITTTINSWFGNKVVVEGAGFLLNNEMDDFSAKPGTPNQFGLVQGENNAVAPGKRMLSAMTPTLVLRPDGELFFVTGTPGGSTIITTVFQTIMNTVDFGMNVADAVNAPRIHHQHLPDAVVYEYRGMDSTTAEALRALGHTLVERDPGPPESYFQGGISGDVQAIMVMEDGSLEAWSDPRRGGRAIGR